MKYFVFKTTLHTTMVVRVELFSMRHSETSRGAHHNVMYWFTGTPAHAPGQRLELADRRKHFLGPEIPFDELTFEIRFETDSKFSTASGDMVPAENAGLKQAHNLKSPRRGSC
jgi:hypothetical protein